ncbi:MAG: acyl-CoA thioesterase [Proteobacteria bacterium]|nr:acyl-CoA thioesterase [Pseudomonadota bacterium]
MVGMDAFPVTIEIPTRWGDLDAFQHVNNTVFFVYFESARIAYFDKLGYRDLVESTGKGPILAETSCRFRRPLKYPDQLTVGARVTDVGEDRFTMEYRIWSAELQTAAAKGTGLIVSYDYRAEARCPLPDVIRERIAALET